MHIHEAHKPATLQSNTVQYINGEVVDCEKIVELRLYLASSNSFIIGGLAGTSVHVTYCTCTAYKHQGITILEIPNSGVRV